MCPALLYSFTLFTVQLQKVKPISLTSSDTSDIRFVQFRGWQRRKKLIYLVMFNRFLFTNFSCCFATNRLLLASLWFPYVCVWNSCVGTNKNQWKTNRFLGHGFWFLSGLEITTITAVHDKCPINFLSEVNAVWRFGIWNWGPFKFIEKNSLTWHLKYHTEVEMICI